LRKTFQVKAFLARQERFVKHLFNNGLTTEDTLSLLMNELQALEFDKEGERLKNLYLKKRKELGFVDLPQVIVDADGKSIKLQDFKEYLLGLRRTRLSMETNGHFCRGLLAARYHMNDNSATSKAAFYD
jgi:hypothetical protein